MQTIYITKSEEIITQDAHIVDTGAVANATITVAKGIRADYTILPNEGNFSRHIILDGNNNFQWNGVIIENSDLTIIAEAKWDNSSANLDILAIATDNSKISVNGVAKVDNPYRQLNMRVDQTNILIGENSIVRGIPRLEIATDDIQGGHSCKVHRLGGDILFYLESHGLETKNAEVLLLNSEILKRLSTLPEDILEEKCSIIHKFLYSKK